MGLWDGFVGFVGEQSLAVWLALFLATGVIAGIFTGFFKARKIQPRGFKWKIFRLEAMVAVVTLLISGTLIGGATKYLTEWGIIQIDKGPAEYWVIALQYGLYFFAFDAYFYWLHRWMHREPVYSWVHKLHHKSTSPNLLTTLSVNPLESVINGGFVPLFLSVMPLFMPIHENAMALITPTNIFMGLYVHSGYEFFPRWWNKSWATKWFITTTFHDQHHKYFTANFGGYTTIWDRLCGTMRPKFEADFDKLHDRRRDAKVEAGPVGEPAEA